MPGAQTESARTNANVYLDMRTTDSLAMILTSATGIKTFALIMQIASTPWDLSALTVGWDTPRREVVVWT